MNRLHPDMATIARAYAPWLDQHVEQASAALSASTAASASIAADSEPVGLVGAADDASDSATAVPNFIADSIRRQVQAKPMLRAPQAGDLVLLRHPLAAHFAQQLDPVLPLVVALEAATDNGWSGWLVGAHSDYAGDRDLVLDASLLQQDIDPAPLAGMVMCWNRVQLQALPQVLVMHQLTPMAVQLISSVAAAEPPHQDTPVPGQLCRRQLLGHAFMTGSGYLRDDPRSNYLRLMQRLGRSLSLRDLRDEGRTLANEPNNLQP